MIRAWLLRWSGHTCPPTQHAELATVRRTNAMVRKERDRAHLLLRSVLATSGPPDWLRNAIVGVTAVDSESDIARNATETADFIASRGGRERIVIRGTDGVKS